MEKEKQQEVIRRTGVIAIIRAGSSENILDAVQAVRDGGLEVMEVTMTTPEALDVIEGAAKRFGDQVLFGAGSVLSAETARAAIGAGARFIVSPTLIPETIDVCRRHSTVVIPGCFTPTEIQTAWELGADFVKVFPAEPGGPPYIKALLAPLSHVALVPTGGVTIENAGRYLRAGAAAVGVGSGLVSQEILDNRNFPLLTERAEQFRAEVAKARKV